MYLNRIKKLANIMNNFDDSNLKYFAAMLGAQQLQPTLKSKPELLYLLLIEKSKESKRHTAFTEESQHGYVEQCITSYSIESVKRPSGTELNNITL